MLIHTDAWRSVSTTDPLNDSDEEANEDLRVEYGWSQLFINVGFVGLTLYVRSSTISHHGSLEG